MTASEQVRVSDEELAALLNSIYPGDDLNPHTYRLLHRALTELQSRRAVPDDVRAAAERLSEWCEGSDGQPIDDAGAIIRFVLGKTEHHDPYKDLAASGGVPGISAVLEPGQHWWGKWIKGRDWECCKWCGILRRADGNNKPCPGKAQIAPRHILGVPHE